MSTLIFTHVNVHSICLFNAHMIFEFRGLKWTDLEFMKFFRESFIAQFWGSYKGHKMRYNVANLIFLESKELKTAVTVPSGYLTSIWSWANNIATERCPGDYVVLLEVVSLPGYAPDTYWLTSLILYRIMIICCKS